MPPPQTTNAVLSDECECSSGSAASCTCYTAERDRLDLIIAGLDSIVNEVELTSRIGGHSYEILQAAPAALANASFDTIVRFLLFSQLESPLDFAFVNLNTHPQPDYWGLNGWAVDSGSQYVLVRVPESVCVRLCVRALVRASVVRERMHHPQQRHQQHQHYHYHHHDHQSS